MAGIYVHIPFCVKKCAYCDFLSFPDMSRAGAYFDALEKEIILSGEEAEGQKFHTVFFGGGTPSALPSCYIERTMEYLRRCFDIELTEATIECNPGTVNIQKLTAYRNAGFNRVSFGVQSFDDALLKGIGRIHRGCEAEECVSLAKKAGFSNINLDLMYGLPGQTRAQYTASIDKAASLGVQHISAYCLILEDGTPLYNSVDRGEVCLLDDDDTYDMHRSGMARLNELGYERYEISNYCKPGFESRHNLNYWNVGEYVGLGLNASSAIREKGGLIRRKNTAALSKYINSVQRGIIPREDVERISNDDEMFEWAMLGLRKIGGVERAEFYERFGVDFVEKYSDAVKKLRDMGWLAVEESGIRLTDTGLDMQNSALLEFME